jgi:hypothetical protein
MLALKGQNEGQWMIQGGIGQSKGLREVDRGWVSHTAQPLKLWKVRWMVEMNRREGARYARGFGR